MIHRTPLLVTLLLAGGLAAQSAPLPEVRQSWHLDSGYLDNAGSAPRTVYQGVVRVAGSPWLRLHFRDCNLPAGSGLRLVGLRDGAVQRFDAFSLRDYEGMSAFFNGDAVRVELIAAAGSTGNRFLVDQVITGPGEPAPPESICGSADNRVPSNDPRVARLMPVGCTAWLISDDCMISAGHCISSTGGMTVQFNVPLSTPSGQLVFPPPQDQYALRAGSLLSSNGGLGSDYAVFKALPNSTTGLLPGAAQGSWFQTSTPPAQIGGVTIRITGYGTTTSPISPTWNQVQKTHTGPRQSVSFAFGLGYRTDTTGGNSGSPVIYEQTGDAIGVHTNGGCNSVGYNSGTGLSNPGFANAVTNCMITPGEFFTFGTGCGGTGGLPRLTFSGTPRINNSFNVILNNLTANQFGAVMVGFNDMVWTGTSFTLPLDLAALGMGGCTLYVSPDIAVSLSTGNLFGFQSLPVNVPNSQALIGSRTWFQYFFLDPGNPNSVHASNTNGGRVTLGG